MRSIPDHAATAYDAVVIGGGPAGALAGSLLASWGRRVAILHRPDRPSHGLAETIPPSTRRILERTGVLAEIDRARFCRTSGNTSWWGKRPRRTEWYASVEGGYQVWRPALDALLLSHARRAGARLEGPVVVRRVEPGSGFAVRVDYVDAAGRRRAMDASFALDCSGRAGVVARKGFRVPEQGFDTVAVCGRWLREKGWSADLEDDTHTTVETTDAGWVWSIPVSARHRYVTIMLDLSGPTTGGWRHGRSLAAMYRDWLAQAPNSVRLLDGARPYGRVFARAASLYTARTFAKGPFLLVGDAGSFIDPLSSYGVKKALASAWRAASVVNTALTHPERAESAFALFDEREREVYESYLTQSNAFFATAAAAHDTPFWTARARASERAHAPADPHAAAGDDVTRDVDVQRALAMLRHAPVLSLRRTEATRIDVRPEFAEREVVMVDWLVGPRVAEGIRYTGRVELPRLLALAEGRGDVGDVLEAYRRHDPRASVDELLSGLALLVGKGLLENAEVSVV